VVTDNLTGVRCRVIKNGFARDFLEMAEKKTDPWEMMQYGVGRIRKAYVEGDLEGGSLAFSQVCGLIHDVPSCKELLDSIVREAEQILESLDGQVRTNGNGNGNGAGRKS
jgi:enoyl-[acyl-carrier protein] reductase II